MQPAACLDVPFPCACSLGFLWFGFGSFLVLDDALSVLDVLQTFFDLFLERRLEVELVHRVERHHWMKEMVCVEAFRADLLLAFQAE